MNRKGADQTAHLQMRSLVSTFVVRKQNQVSRGESHIKINNYCKADQCMILFLNIFYSRS